MPEQVPSIGRIVHFVLDEGRNKGEHRAAQIVRTWGTPDQPAQYVNLVVFLDGSNDDAIGGALTTWRTSVQPDFSEQPAPRTWHWPEFVPPATT